MAEIAAEIHIDSTGNLKEGKPEIHDTIIDSIKESKTECSNFETKELSASNELICTQFNDNSLLCDIDNVKHKDETDHFRISNINKADDNFNYNMNVELQQSKTYDNLRNQEGKNLYSNISCKDDLNNKKLFESINLIDPGKKLPGNSASEILKVYSENEVMFSYDVECSDGARDLIQRLLNPDPQKRLRSLLSLQNIRFFKDVNFADIRMKKIAPADILRKHFPNGPIINKYSNQVKLDGFADFDSVFV